MQPLSPDVSAGAHARELLKSRYSGASGGGAAPNPSAQAFSFPESLPAQSQIPTIGRRGHAGRQAEQAVEMRQVVETCLRSNPRDGRSVCINPLQTRAMRNAFAYSETVRPVRRRK